MLSDADAVRLVDQLAELDRRVMELAWQVGRLHDDLHEVVDEVRDQIAPHGTTPGDHFERQWPS